MGAVVSLSKGEKVELTKGKGITQLRVGLNWEEAGKHTPETGSGSGSGSVFGFFRGLLNVESSAPTPNVTEGNIDIDSSIIMLNNQDKFVELVYFGHKVSDCGSIKHHGDNLTGADNGQEDDEVIDVYLDKVPSRVQRLVVVANIYSAISRKQHFGMINSADIRIYNQTGEQLCQYNLTKEYSGKTAIIVGDLYRSGADWKFSAIGQGTTDPGLEALTKRYR